MRHRMRTKRALRRLVGAAYLMTGGATALNTVNAYRPLAWTGRGSVASFFAGFVTSEVPLGSLALAAAQTGMAVRAGALHTRSGRAGLALTAASAAALAALPVRARPTERILDAALRDAL